MNRKIITYKNYLFYADFKNGIYNEDINPSIVVESLIFNNTSNSVSIIINDGKIKKLNITIEKAEEIGFLNFDSLNKIL